VKEIWETDKEEVIVRNMFDSVLKIPFRRWKKPHYFLASYYLVVLSISFSFVFLLMYERR